LSISLRDPETCHEQHERETVRSPALYEALAARRHAAEDKTLVKAFAVRAEAAPVPEHIDSGAPLQREDDDAQAGSR
jgi:hypothetical protein